MTVIYRKKHLIIGSVDGIQVNYQMKITVHYGSGSDNGAIVYCGGNCKTDFSDIWFSKADGTTELDYWMEASTTSSVAVFWVEMDSIPAAPGSVFIYMNYGDPARTTTSNGVATFPFFDDFNDGTNSWTVVKGIWNESGGVLYEVLEDGVYWDRVKKSYTNANGAVRFKVKQHILSSISSATAGIIARAINTDGTNSNYDLGYGFLLYVDSGLTYKNKARIYEFDTGASVREISVGNATILDNAFYTAEARLYNNSFKFAVNDVLITSGSDDSYTSGTHIRLVSSISMKSYWEFVLQRNYTINEPVSTLWDGEETIGYVNWEEPAEIEYIEPPIIQDTRGVQIEMSKDAPDLSTTSTPHGIYTFHSSTENSGNRMKITVWNPEENPAIVSNNPIIEMSADNKVRVVHILPMRNEEYSIGSDEKRWLIVVGNRMYNDTTQSKTLSVHSGR